MQSASFPTIVHSTTAGQMLITVFRPHAEVVAEAATAIAAQIQEQLIEAFAAGTEGLMLKALKGPGAGYHPSKRSESWLKVKK